MKVQCAVVVLMMGGLTAGVRVGLLWPQHCTGDMREACEEMNVAAEAAVGDFKPHGVPWNPVLVHAGDGDTHEELCNLMEGGVGGLIGPLTSEAATLVGRLAGWHQVPMISPAADSHELADRTKFQYFRRTVPGTEAQGHAIAEYLRELNWSTAGALYERGSEHAESIMHAAVNSFSASGGRMVFVESAPSGLTTEGYQEPLHHIRDKYVQAVMLLGSTTFVASILNATLDPHNPPPLFSGGRVWITSEGVEDEAHGIAKLYPHLLNRVRGLLTVQVPPASLVSDPVAHLNNALGRPDSGRQTLPQLTRTTYDAVSIMLEALDRTGAWRSIYHSDHCAEPTAPWAGGPLVLSYLDGHEYDGTMGHLNLTEIDHFFRYDLVNLQLDPMHPSQSEWYTTGVFLPNSAIPEDLKAGRVSVNDGTVRRRRYCADCRWFVWPGKGFAPDSGQLLSGVHLHILGVEDHPYLHFDGNKTWCEAQTPPPDRGCYSGALWTLLLDLRDKFHFSFDIHVTHGMLHEAEAALADPLGQYDLLLANIPITEPRMEVLDFTQPMFDTESVILVRVPVAAEPAMFRFLEPFSAGMWGTVLGMIVMNALVFYWLENGISEGIADGWAGGEDSFYWSYTAFLFTAPFMPATRGGRLLSLGFFFIALVTLSVYTAQLTVFLLREDALYEFERFGSFLGGDKSMSQLVVTKDSVEHVWICSVCSCCDDPTTRPQLLDFIPATPTEPEQTAHEQIPGLLLGQCDTSDHTCPVGVVVEKHLAEYLSGTHCEITIHPSAGQGVEGQGSVPTLDRFGLGLALRKGSPYTTILSGEIVRLREMNWMSNLKLLWFSGTCPSLEDRLKPPTDTSLKTFSGMYVIFAVTILLTVLYKWSFILRARMGCGGADDVDGDGKADDLIKAERLRRESWVASPLSANNANRVWSFRTKTKKVEVTPELLRRMATILERKGATVTGLPPVSPVLPGVRSPEMVWASSEGESNSPASP
eukprot:Hpha_TRINITY_DN7805_c0_g2::TRINITY_DN7805_c0_g2_i1::g.185521::m.185521